MNLAQIKSKIAKIKATKLENPKQDQTVNGVSWGGSQYSDGRDPKVLYAELGDGYSYSENYSGVNRITVKGLSKVPKKVLLNPKKHELVVKTTNASLYDPVILKDGKPVISSSSRISGKISYSALSENYTYIWGKGVRYLPAGN